MKKLIKPIFVLSLVFVFVLGILPAEKLPEPAKLSDKLNHFIAFFYLTMLYYLSFNSTSRAVYFIFSFSFLIEVTQYFIPYRTFSILDLLANFMGILLATLFIKNFQKVNFKYNV